RGATIARSGPEGFNAKPRGAKIKMPGHRKQRYCRRDAIRLFSTPVMKAKRQPARVILPSRRSVREWLEAFAACVRARDFAGGRVLFGEDAMGCGTVATVAEARAVLIREQWRRVWTRTAGLRFERKGSRVEVSPDGLMAVAMVRWRASNNPANPRRLDRRG